MSVADATAASMRENGRRHGTLHRVASEVVTDEIQKWDNQTVRLFDRAADEYDAARPTYPAGLYNRMESVEGPLAVKVVGDCGAGMGAVSSQLLERGTIGWRSIPVGDAARCPDRNICTRRLRRQSDGGYSRPIGRLSQR